MQTNWHITVHLTPDDMWLDVHNITIEELPQVLRQRLEAQDPSEHQQMLLAFLNTVPEE
jgi:hypothetical protein